MKTNGNDILRVVSAVSPQDAPAVASWLINQQPHQYRHGLVEEVSKTIRSHYLSGGPYANWSAPQCFGFEEANQLWEDFIALLDEEAITAKTEEQRSSELSLIEKLAHYFKPDVEFTPIAYAERWAPPEWSFPLSPAEVRKILAIEEKDITEIKRVIEQYRLSVIQSPSFPLVDSNVVPFPQEPSRKNGNLRIGVLPYADTLALPALLYAVSDLVDGLEFCIASFYRGSESKALQRYILSGKYDVGYATDYQLAESSVRRQYSRRRVFEDIPFTRSIILRQWRTVPHHEPASYNSLSFVGDFAGDNMCDFAWAEKGFPLEAHLFKVQKWDLTSQFDPITDWESELTLALLSNAGLGKSLDHTHQGQAVFVSTDVHLWASYLGLISAPLTERDEHGAGAEVWDGVAQPNGTKRFGRATWLPIEKNPMRPIPDAEKRSQLCWFIPGRPGHAFELESTHRLVDKYITHRVTQMFTDAESEDDPSIMRLEASKIGRCLLAPLLVAHPWYRGPMMSTPPDQWLVKLQGPAAHIEHIPRWRTKLREWLKGAPTDVVKNDLVSTLGLPRVA